MAKRRWNASEGVKTRVPCQAAPAAFARAGGAVPVGLSSVQVTWVVHVTAGAITLQARVPFQRSFFRPFPVPALPFCFSPPKSRKVCVSMGISVAPVRNPIAPVAVVQFASVQEIDLFAIPLVDPSGNPAYSRHPL